MSTARRLPTQAPGSGGLRRRLLRHHLPLAIVSCIVLVLFMTLPRFDADRYAHADLTSSVFPKERQRSAAAVDEHPARSGGHGRPRTGSSAHGGGHGGSMPDRMSHGGANGGGMSHGGDGSMPPGRGQNRGADSSAMGGPSFLGLGNRAFTVATGYLATALLAVTLLIGPANVLLRRRNPVSSYLRRDVGIWTAIFSGVHVLYGLQVHRRLGDFLDYFFDSDGSPLVNSFGLANWSGLAAVAVVLGLLALSSNTALRKLKAKKWKRLQRFNYALFVLVVAHAFFYGAFVRTNSPYTLMLVLVAVAAFAGQTAGAAVYRRRDAARR